MAKNQRPRIDISTPFFAILMGGASIMIYVAYPWFILAALFAVFGVISCAVMIVWWVTSSFQLGWSSDVQRTNATLTCKNGHTGRVWVKMGPLDRTDDPEGMMAGMTYVIEGHEVREGASKISPECCPECGAEWQVPQKRKHYKPLKYVSDLQRKT